MSWLHSRVPPGVRKPAVELVVSVGLTRDGDCGMINSASIARWPQFPDVDS